MVRALDILVDSEKAAGALLAASMVVPPGLKGAIEEEAEARDEAQTSEPSVTEASVESVAAEQPVAAPFATSVESDPTVADPSRMEQKAELASSQAPSEDANTASESPSPAVSQSRRRTVEDTSAKNKERLRKNPDPTNLSNSYGGEAFSLATQSSDFIDTLLFPQANVDQEKLKGVLEEISAADRWAATHARRVAFVASAIANSLGFSRERDEAIRTAALLFSLSWKDGSLGSMRLDMFRDQPEAAVQALGDGMKRSGALVRKTFGHERAARLLEIGASILQRQTPVGAADLVRDAQCVLLVELADRSCWNSGFWYPFGAYRTIRYLRSENTMFTDRPLAAAMSRVLGESVTSHVTVGNAFVSSLEDEMATPTRKGSGREAREIAPGVIERNGRETRILTVQITDLLPGMRLAQPLKALDGRLILDAQIRIDEEIVLQLWQLAAVRALSDRVAIEVEF